MASIVRVIQMRVSSAKCVVGRVLSRRSPSTVAARISTTHSAIPPSLSLLRSFHSTSVKAEAVNAGESSPERTSLEDEARTTAEQVAEETRATHSFQAETSQLLQIVAKSLYTDKEVFLRELISNASDALEKLRYLRQTDQGLGGAADGDDDLKIMIFTDEEAGTITIQDSGVGLTEQELVNNLGKIASSGTKRFVESLSEGDTAQGLIGQFGVGFYSSFMVAEEVIVYSQHAGGSAAHEWRSDGYGSYTVAQASGVAQGTKIVIRLTPECKEQFASAKTVESVIKKYSNFVNFPIVLNGSPVNTVQAIWAMDKNKVTDEQHLEFYRFIGNAWDEPKNRLWYNADVPVSIKALLYVPGSHMERMGMGQQDPGVSLYSRKVLIQPKSAAILPEWLRFLKGIVDSEDIPLNISRETMQDSSLIRKLNRALTTRIIKWLGDEAKKDPLKHQEFFSEFGTFLKEGICMDATHRHSLVPLLRYESSKADGVTTFEDYISRMPEDQEEIFYLPAPNRALAEMSPYYETFNAKGTEVFFVYQTIDPFVLDNIRVFKDKKVVNIEQSIGSTAEDSKPQQDWAVEFCSWLKGQLGDRVIEVKPSNRLVNSPCVLVNHDTAAYRHMMKLNSMDSQMFGTKEELEVNLDHKIIKQLNNIRENKPELAAMVAEQVYDNALVAAGILEDPRSMLSRLNGLLESAMDGKDEPPQ